jgi:hypothetical protein
MSTVKEKSTICNKLLITHPKLEEHKAELAAIIVWKKKTSYIAQKQSGKEAEAHKNMSCFKYI